MNVEQFPPEHQEPPTPNTPDQTGAALPTCAEVEALVPAYSLGATDPEETLLVQARLAACPSAIDELADYAALADAMLYSAPPTTAPAHLATRLQMALHQPAFTSQRMTWWAKLRDLSWHWHWSYNQLAAAVVILLLLGLNLYAMVQNRKLQTQAEQLTSKQAELNQALVVLLATEKVREVTLPAAQESSQARADVLWNTEAGVAVLYARTFPTLPADKAYQLWLLRDGKRSSGGLFQVDPNGAGILIFPITQPLDTLQAMGITTEPLHGSPGPTSKPVVRKQFQ